MPALMEAALAFPTVVFTVMLGFVLLYAVLVIVGAFDLEFIDGVLGIDFADGAVESIEGAFDGVDGALDGAEGALEGADGLDLEDTADVGFVSGIMAALGIAGVPITVWGSVFVLLAWTLSMIGMTLVAPLLTDGIVGYSISTGVGLAAFFVGGFVAARLVRPLRKIYITERAPRRGSLVGKSCTVLSGLVDETSGRGEIDDGGSGFIADIRCAKQNNLKRGDRALVFDYDPINGVFHVVQMDDELEAIERGSA